MHPSQGKVYLVGAGPGDPGLFTLAGADALRAANTVVYDRLVHPRILAMANRSAKKVYVGKEADHHALTQDKINILLAEEALAGNTVVRLKGGDPFVFGRGGEEAEFLRERGIEFEIVPGVTSAIAGPAYAGIPVTHRDAASSFAVVTGHERDDKRESGGREAGPAEMRRDWAKIAGAADIGEIAAQLVNNGRSPETPVALVRWATWAGRQQVLTATLANVAQRVHDMGFKAPAVTVVGEVVRWRERLAWWDTGPLSGKRIVVTRARDQASALSSLLEASGAEAIEFPVIRIVPPAMGYGELDRAIQEIGEYAWIVFTSVNTVPVFADRLRGAGLDTRALYRSRIAAIGPATADALRKIGVAPDFVPNEFTGEHVARAFPEPIVGTRILIPRAAEASEALPRILAERGADVQIVPAYETEREDCDSEVIRERIAEGSIDCVTFTSSSTVKNFVAALGPTPPSLTAVALACIGPSTAQTARELFQREPDILATRYTISGLMEAILEFYSHPLAPGAE
jgi:uroporphyrinogen III methyltransferase/synthase